MSDLRGGAPFLPSTAITWSQPAGLTAPAGRIGPVCRRIARPGGRVWSPRLPALPAIVYQVYANTGVGDPINYATPIATTTALTFTTASLNPGGSYQFAVRAMDPATGLVDQNLDCAVQILLNTQGNDVTLRPTAPMGLRAFALAGGSVRVEWSYLSVDRATLPVGFNVYLSSSGTLSYMTPRATVPYVAGEVSYGVTLTGLAGGAICTIAARAYNAAAEEPNTTTVAVVALTAGPAAVDALVAGAS